MSMAVVTHRTREDLLGDNGGTFAFDGLEPAARRARDAAGDKDVMVLGAHVAGQLLRAGLLDEVRIHLVPLLMGEGTPLFAGERGEPDPGGQARRGSRDPPALSRSEALTRLAACCVGHRLDATRPKLTLFDLTGCTHLPLAGWVPSFLAVEPAGLGGRLVGR